MDRLINVDVAIKELIGKPPYKTLDWEIKAAQFLKCLDPVDAVPVRHHGRWIGSGENVYCSECRNHPLKDMDKDSVYYWRYQPNYCPNCGAKMDGSDKDAAD